jgi:putative ABC transport system permease protein
MIGFYLDSPAIPSNRKQINSYYRNMLTRIEAVPGVTNVAAMSHLPLDRLHEATRFLIAGRPEYNGASSSPSADIQTATPDYFRTFGIRIARGRGFSNADDETNAKVAMVNEAFAARFLTGLDPLNQQILMDEWIPGSPNPVPAVQWQIVGVFHTVKSRGAREDVPQIAVPFWQMGPGVARIGVRT